jgi:hypothetical protein
MTLQSIKDLAKHIKTNENGNLVYDNGSFKLSYLGILIRTG